jgi:hypothetical protein
MRDRLHVFPHGWSCFGRCTGFGLRLGAESQWHLNSSWSLFGSTAGSILYGRFRTHLLETERAGVDTKHRSENYCHMLGEAI